MEIDDLKRVFEGELEAVRIDNQEDKRRLRAIFEELREFYDQQLDLAKRHYQNEPVFPQSNVDTEVINLACPSSLPSPEQRKKTQPTNQTQQQPPSSPHLNPSTLDNPSGEVGGTSCPANQVGEAQPSSPSSPHLKLSTLDPPA